MKSIQRIALMLGFIAGFCLHAHAGDYCRGQPSLALVLAADSSISIKRNEWLLQKEGYVSAFRHPEVIKAILGSECGRIMVTFVQWSGTLKQVQAVPWRLLDSPESIERFASQIDKMGRMLNDDTSIGGAIYFSLGLFGQLPVQPLRKIIDISGDGPDNTPEESDGWRDAPPEYPNGDPYTLKWGRNDAVRKGVTINGLSIQSFEHEDGEEANEFNMHAYYENYVKTPDGFVVPAEGFQNFAQAIRRKLVLEIALAN